MFNGVRIIDDIVVSCKQCGCSFKIDKEDFDHESYSIGSSGMGECYEHCFSCSIECDCGEELNMKLLVPEYPIGAIDRVSFESDNCDILELPNVEMDYVPDEFYSILELISFNPNTMSDISPYDFECLISEMLAKKGFVVNQTKQTRDGGKDIIASFSKGSIPFTIYIECKHYSNPVGPQVVRSLYGVIENDRIDKGVIISSSWFSPQAIKEAKQTNDRIILIDREGILNLLK